MGMLSSVALYCQFTMTVITWGPQLFEMSSCSQKFTSCCDINHGMAYANCHCHSPVFIFFNVNVNSMSNSIVWDGQTDRQSLVLRYRDIMLSQTQSGQLQTHIIRLKPHKPVFVRHIEAAKQALISKNHSNVISPAVSGGQYNITGSQHQVILLSW